MNQRLGSLVLLLLGPSRVELSVQVEERSLGVYITLSFYWEDPSLRSRHQGVVLVRFRGLYGTQIWRRGG